MDLEQQSSPCSFSFTDVLLILPSAAREGLVAALTLLPSTRLSCRALRDLIDFQQTRLTVRLDWLAPNVFEALCQDGRWLRRWPRCTSVTLWADEEEIGALAAPFLAAPPEACQRITDLTVRSRDAQLSGSTLLALLTRLPQLTKLVLRTGGPATHLPLEAPLTPMALSLLPCLKDLTATWTYLHCIPSSLAGQLTVLELKPCGDRSRAAAAELAAGLPRMTALKELILSTDAHQSFTPAEVLQLLNAAPPSMTRMQIDGVEVDGMSLSFTLANSALDTVHLNASWAMPYAYIASVLAAAVLPSSALGLRLGLLGLPDLLVHDRTLPDPDPAAHLLSRCDRVEVGNACMSATRSPLDAMPLLRKLGAPRSLEWDSPRGFRATVALTQRELGAAARRPVLHMRTMVVRVVQRMASSAGAPGSILLLRGPFIRGLWAVPTGLRATLQSLGRAAVGPSPHVLSCHALPVAGAVVLDYRDPESAEAAAADARRLAQAASGGPESAGVGMLEVLRPSLPLESAIAQVLQALWDGEEEGEQVADATIATEEKAGTGGGAGDEAGAASGSSGGGGGSGPTSELDRVQWLLETWEGLLGWISDVDLEDAHA